MPHTRAHLDEEVAVLRVGERGTRADDADADAAGQVGDAGGDAGAESGVSWSPNLDTTKTKVGQSALSIEQRDIDHATRHYHDGGCNKGRLKDGRN